MVGNEAAEPPSVRNGVQNPTASTLSQPCPKILPPACGCRAAEDCFRFHLVLDQEVIDRPVQRHPSKVETPFKLCRIGRQRSAAASAIQALFCLIDASLCPQLSEVPQKCS
jgi:hypothetical protein